MIVVVKRHYLMDYSYNHNNMLYMVLSHPLSRSILTPCGDTVKQ